MPSDPASLATRFADPWESTEAPIADFGFMALITRWKTRSHTSIVCEKSLRKNYGGSSLARKVQSRIPRRVQRGSLHRNEKLGTDDLIAYLNRLRKVTEEELRRFIAGKKSSEPDSSPRPERVTSSERKTGNGRSEFRILEHVGTVRKVGRNYVARCPSCADSGHDRSGDNLAILIEDPRFYKCWAGCTKEMIRAALGCPIRVRHSA